jgi:hypothetical protein
VPLDYPRDGAARCGDIIIYSARTSPPLLPSYETVPRVERGTPPPARIVASLDSSSSSLLDLLVVVLLPDLVLLRLRSSSVGLGQRHGGGAAPRVERGTPPPAGAVASLDSSSSSLLDLVVVVVLLLDLDLVLLRLLLHAWGSARGMARAGAACVAERWRGAVDLLEFFGVAAPWRWPRRSSSA